MMPANIILIIFDVMETDAGEIMRIFIPYFPMNLPTYFFI